MKPRVSTLFLKSVLVVFGLAVLAFCVYFIPFLAQAPIKNVPQFTISFYPALAGLSLSALPFFFALFQAFLLLRLIDRNNAFSYESLHALRNIKFSAIAMSICYAFCLPMAFIFAELDDAPGLILISTAIACAPLIVATFAAVLQKLVQSAVDMKTENDLTV